MTEKLSFPITITTERFAANRIHAGSQIAIDHDLRDQLTGMVLESSQTGIAAQLGITVQYLNDILHAKRPVSGMVSEKLGWKRQTVFVRLAP